MTNPVCPACASYTEGLVTTAKVSLPPHEPPMQRHTAYCDRCHHLLTWTQQTRLDGSVSLGRLQIMRGKRTVEAYLKAHPVETGTIAR